MKRPKDMTQEELDALPKCSADGTRIEEYFDPKTSMTVRRLISEPGTVRAVQMDDIIHFRGSDGLLYRPIELDDGWYKAIINMG